MCYLWLLIPAASVMPRVAHLVRPVRTASGSHTASSSIRLAQSTSTYRLPAPTIRLPASTPSIDFHLPPPSASTIDFHFQRSDLQPSGAPSFHDVPPPSDIQPPPPPPPISDLHFQHSDLQLPAVTTSTTSISGTSSEAVSDDRSNPDISTSSNFFGSSDAGSDTSSGGDSGASSDDSFDN